MEMVRQCARCAVHLVGGIGNNRLFKEEMCT